MRSATVLNSNGSSVESVLSINEKRLTLAQKIASLGCWEYDIKSKTLWGSEEYFKILGLPKGPRETHFDEIGSLINEIDLVKQSMFELITTGKEYSIEYSCVQKGTGKLIMVRTNAEAIKNDEGVVTKVIGTFQDITDQKRSNEAHKSAESEFPTLVEREVDLVFTTNLQGEGIYVNKGSSIRFAPVQNELAWLFFPEKYIEKVLKKFDHVIQTGGAAEIVFQKTTLGNSLWLHTVISPIIDSENVKAVTFMTRDVTSIKTSEKKIAELQFADLEKTKNELDHFAYSLSHDLKAPITTILGLLNLSNHESSQMNFEELKFLIKESAEKLETTINGMSDYFYNIRNDVQTQKIEFKNLIQELEKEIKDSGNINLQISINDKFPLHTDLKRLKTIFFQLWTNAVVFKSKLNTANLKIKIKTTRDHALIIFQDNGIGIAQEDLSKVFQMFYRGSILSKGSGLGLAIVYETITKLGGEIAVRSELGKYSIFEILLPNPNKENEMVLSI